MEEELPPARDTCAAGVGVFAPVHVHPLLCHQCQTLLCSALAAAFLAAASLAAAAAAAAALVAGGYGGHACLCQRTF
eukprot:1158514-Pelagomonas_calceolata.AAC.16